MTVEEIKSHYSGLIEQADTAMEKNLLKAEMNHKLKLLDLNQETDYQKMSSDSQFECIGCSA